METKIDTKTEAQTEKKPRRIIKTPGSKPAAKGAPKAPKAEVAAEPKRVNVHIEAGVEQTHDGLSSYINANRKVAVRMDVTAGVEDMTPRMQKGLYALRKAYGGKSWSARGFDNGVLAHLRAAGLIELNGGQTQNIDGHPKLLDAAQPVTGKVTAAGMKYGVPAAK